jgi:hypothetical protein
MTGASAFVRDLPGGRRDDDPIVSLKTGTDEERSGLAVDRVIEEVLAAHKEVPPGRPITR